MMPRSLAKLVSEQLLAAHNQVAKDVLDTLWAIPEVREEMVCRVMNKQRVNTHDCKYELRKTDNVALICTLPAEGEDGLTTVDNVLCPADKLPEWLFIFLFHWMRDTLHRERPYPIPGGNGWECQPAARCGFGGLLLNPPTCEHFLKIYDFQVGRHGDMEVRMFNALGMDVKKEFAWDLEQLAREVGEKVDTVDPLRKWPAKTAKKVRDYIEQNHHELLGAYFVGDLEEEMAVPNAEKWRQEAAVLTLVFDSKGWGWV